jgi:hypothetical protein
MVEFGEHAPLRFGGSGGGNLAVSSISATGVTTLLVFKELALPGAKTSTDKEAAQEEAALTQLKRPRTFGGFVRYERVDFEKSDPDLSGNIYSTNLHMAWDIDNFSFGTLIPYDHLDLKSFDANMIGTVLYGQYKYPLNKIYSVGVTVNGNYMFMGINNKNINDVNTFGGGVSLSVTMDRELLVLGGAVSYQYNQDDSSSVNDHQHLIKLGTDVGVRIGKNAVVNLFGIWNVDPTDYKDVPRGTDHDSFDLGIEMALNLSKTWDIKGGYKEVLGLQNFASHMIFLGTLLRF